MASVYIQLPLSTSTITGSIATTQAALTPDYDQSLVIDQATVVTITKPIGAKKAKVWAGSNSVNLRVTMDGLTAPSSTVGFILEPNRAEDFEGVGDLKVIAENTASNQELSVHWSY